MSCSPYTLYTSSRHSIAASRTALHSTAHGAHVLVVKLASVARRAVRCLPLCWPSPSSVLPWELMWLRISLHRHAAFLPPTAYLSGSPTSWMTLCSTQLLSSLGMTSAASPALHTASATNCSRPWRTFQFL